MSDVRTSLTNQYIRSTRSILDAGQQLRDLLGEDDETQEFAVSQLEIAAQQYEYKGTDLQAFMFSELETPTEQVVSEQATEDALATILTDVDVANVLMAAGQAVGEIDGVARASLLDDALLELDNTTRAVERVSGSPTAEMQPRRFGFAEDIVVPQIAPSADLSSAVETFRRESHDTLVTLVTESQGAVTSIVTRVSQLDQSQILASLGTLGAQMPDLGDIGRLFSRGVKKLKEAIDALIRLLGREALTKVKAQVEKIWHDAKEGKYTTRVLEWAFNTEATRSQVEDVLRSQGLNQKSIDQANNALVQLRAKFKEKLTMIRRLVVAVSVASFLLAFTTLPGPHVALGIASAYTAIIGAIVLIGMDYTDSGRILHLVRGVGEIAEDIRPAQ